jgi:elongator complex protein 3
MDSHFDAWRRARRYTDEQMTTAAQALVDIRRGLDVDSVFRLHPLPGGGYLGKHMLLEAYRGQVARGEYPDDPQLLARLRMKPVRTLSGVTTVTVLTKPYPCPGQCIFCPTDVKMPKSYLADEPGSRRALQHEFDPYRQVKYRLMALQAIGHPTDKVELLVLGGTWSAYRRDYREWFLLRCFDALNEVDAPTLEEAQRLNETALHRNVGLVIETRPDHVDAPEIRELRRMGVTKVQMGAQSFDDRILALNRRGHTAAETLRAVDLLRAGGFKIVLHWMPNLYGATPAGDREDFAHLWEGYCPDEIKIYPNQLLQNTDLYPIWLAGDYRPYTTQELVELIAEVKPTIPEYCRVNRVIRDIPSNNVVEGNKRTSLRQDVQEEMKRRGTVCRCLRCREVRGQAVRLDELDTRDRVYATGHAEEHFLEFVTPDDRIAGFLRLSLPGESSPPTGLTDLDGAAIIREVHVYGQSLPVGGDSGGAAQHIGLGRLLLAQAERIARQAGYKRLAVIAAVGTRRYYERRGFRRGDSYLIRELG